MKFYMLRALPLPVIRSLFSVHWDCPKHVEFHGGVNLGNRCIWLVLLCRKNYNKRSYVGLKKYILMFIIVLQFYNTLTGIMTLFMLTKYDFAAPYLDTSILLLLLTGYNTKIVVDENG
jgi:hypothetical protein